MYAPTPSSIQTHEYRRQERLAHAAQMRFIADARRPENAGAAEITKPRQATIRSIVASVVSIVFALTTKLPAAVDARDPGLRHRPQA